MRYPACLILSIAMSVATVRAAYAPAPVSSPPAPVATASTSSPTTPAAPAAPIPAASGSSAAPASTAPATPAAPVPVTAAMDLFDGKDMKGWVLVAQGNPDIATICKVTSDGVMTISKAAKGFLQIPIPRANYKLHVEWRWPSAVASNNNGELINISSGPVQQGLWPTSFQVQGKPNNAGDVLTMGDAKCAEVAAGATTAVKKEKSSEKPIGQWNEADITVRGDTIECTVNGVLQNKVTKCVPSSGNIGFQLEGYAYEMRNIKLSPLPAPTP
jgi:hypothetical protein